MVRWRVTRKWSWNLQNKIEIRKQLQQKRRAITLIEREQAGVDAAKWFSSHKLFHQSKNIGCYLALKDEFDCAPLIEAIWQAKKNCYLPVLSTTEDLFLDFALYHRSDPLHYNRYKILEPENKNIIAPSELDVVIMPLVGFDLQGHRLGMGGGYYDRTFAFLLQKPVKKPVMVGLGYQAQQVDALPHDEWDVSVDGILTEQGFTTIS